MLRTTEIQIMPAPNELEDIWVLLRDNHLVSAAQSNKGIRRKNDDYFGVIPNSFDPDLILSLVCDGVGGLNDGDQASAYVVKELGSFFKTLDPEIINDPVNLRLALGKILGYINYDVPSGLTTLTCAINTKNGLAYVNAGDSRLYGISDDLTQLSSDDSLVWNLYTSGRVKKSNLRFLYNNNVITNALGYDDFEYNFRFIKENPYNAILLVSDGVSDVLSDEQMKEFIDLKNAESSLQSMLIEASVNHFEEIGSDLYRMPDFLDCVFAGKDNATAVLTLLPSRRK